jgi:hypothetical protein
LLLVATSFQNPYYPALALQLLLLASLRSWLIGARAAAFAGVCLTVVGLASFFLNQSNVYIRATAAGPNAAFSGRGLSALLHWGLRLPDLFLPHAHPVGFWRDFAMDHYFNAGNPISENSFAFLGIVGCVLLAGLVIMAVARGLRGRFDDVPWQAWLTGYVVLFAVAGGLDYVLGALGMTWLRATNRYSIVILCALLFWGSELADRIARRTIRMAIIGAALILAGLELFGRRDPDQLDKLVWIKQMVMSDRDFAVRCERELRKAAVFQLPVVGFPEWPTVHQMTDYEHFRPYLWSKSLRFSYGTHKGREREEWQSYAGYLAPDKLVSYLEDHGFDAIMINRRAFVDRGAELESKLVELTRGQITSKAGDLTLFKLSRRQSRLPTEFSSLSLDKGFPWGWEAHEGGRWAWSNGTASLRLGRSLDSGKRYRVSFTAETFASRRLDVFIGERRMASAILIPGTATSVDFEWDPRPNEVILRLETDQPPTRPGNGDPRAFGFRIVNPTIESSPRRP